MRQIAKLIWVALLSCLCFSDPQMLGDWLPHELDVYQQIVKSI